MRRSTSCAGRPATTSLYVNNDDAAGGAGNDIIRVYDADGRLSGGTGSDYFEVYAYKNGGNSTVITDFSDQDLFGIAYQDAANNPAWSYADTQLFCMLDRNHDNRLTGNDGFSTTAEGINIGVSQSAFAVTLFLGEDSIRFENVAQIASTDWITLAD